MNVRYLVCATHRSGSSFLCEGLEATGIAGKPQEPFTNPEVRKIGPDPEEVKAVIQRSFELGRTPNGVSGMKIMVQQLENIVQKLSHDPKSKGITPEEVLAFFGPVKYIWITRRDKTAQAVSLAKAMQTDIWNRHPGEVSRTEKDPVFHLNEIDDFVRDLERQDDWWGKYFKKRGIEPFKVVYEDLVSRYEETALEILRYLGIPVSESMSPPKPRIMKQADDQSAEWVRRYSERGWAAKALLFARRIVKKPLLLIYGVSWKLEKTIPAYKQCVKFVRSRFGPWLRFHDRY